jgi:hypothetical protein
MLKLDCKVEHLLALYFGSTAVVVVADVVDAAVVVVVVVVAVVVAVAVVFVEVVVVVVRQEQQREWVAKVWERVVVLLVLSVVLSFETSVLEG